MGRRASILGICLRVALGVRCMNYLDQSHKHDHVCAKTVRGCLAFALFMSSLRIPEPTDRKRLFFCIGPHLGQASRPLEVGQ